MKSLKLIFTITLTCVLIYSCKKELFHDPVTTWIKTFGGSSYDYGTSITYTADGGSVIAGYAMSKDGDFIGLNQGSTDIFVIRLNSDGITRWIKTFGGSSTDDYPYITQTVDGGFVLTGSTSSNDGDFSGLNLGSDDIFVIKLDSDGNTLWIKTFGGSYPDWGSTIAQTGDGGFVLTGYFTSYDGDFSGVNIGDEGIFVIKLDSDGNTRWIKTFVEIISGNGTNITQTVDNGCVLSGYSKSDSGAYTDKDILVIKLDSDGNTNWKKTFGGSRDDYCSSITQAGDAGYVITGYTGSSDGDFSGVNPGDEDIFVIKLDSDGNTRWIKTFGGNYLESCSSINQTGDGGYVLTGYTNSNDGDFSGLNLGSFDIFVIKLDSDGNSSWIKTYGGSSFDMSESITQTGDGGLVLTGNTESDDGDFSGLKLGSWDIFVIKLK
jgi:hypothetical protein